MELTTLANNHCNTPDSENETPPPTVDQPTKSLSFTNGSLKKHSQTHHHHQPPAVVVVVYKECLKNHAAAMGGHAVDGCGEFMPSPAANPTDPTSLKCAACGCHRNFHRREDDSTTHLLDFHCYPLLPPPPPRRNSPLSSSPSPPPPPQPSYYSSAPHMLLALSTGPAIPEDQRAVATPVTPTAAKAENPNGRKRFRTKFSQEQKEKMFSFSEKLGWKMQRCDERLVEDFCNEIGVRKGVLKVWMHNNKNTLGRRDINPTATATNHQDINSNGRVLSFDNNNNGDEHHDVSSNGAHLHVSTSGSPSSA